MVFAVWFVWCDLCGVVFVVWFLWCGLCGVVFAVRFATVNMVWVERV